MDISHDRRLTGAQTVHRACHVLKTVARAGHGGMRLSDLAHELGLNRSTAYRLVQALVAEGFVTPMDDARRYTVGLDFFSLAASAGNPGGLQDVCRPSLLRLSAAIGDTLFLMVRSGYDLTCVDRIEGQYPIQAVMKGVGGRVPLGLVPSGMVVLAHLPAAEQEEILRVNMPQILNELCPDEIAIRAALQRAREDGYTISTGVLIENVGGVSVPLFDRRERVVGAIAVGGFADRFTEIRRREILSLMRRETEEIRRRLDPFAALSTMNTIR